MSKQQQMASSISSTEDIASLLEFQDKLLNIVHSEVYAHQPVDDDILVRFQINHITEVNDAWKRMIDDLLFRLVKQRIPYESTLRDHFHKVLVADFLPCIRINRHELAQVSLFGFDIYIEPLSTILQIINRIDGQKHIISKQQPANAPQRKWAMKPSDVWESIKVSWNEFIYCASLCKISVNVYILKQYLKMAAQSLVKKDKQIIFTGCSNLFSQMVPCLKQNKQLWLLIELAQLNNELYNFHPSFNYSHFYSLMLPLRAQYEPVFQVMKVVAGKCLSANILTPFLFAIMRNRSAFLQFIQEVDDKCWVGYLNGLIFALIYNFKARILEYEEVIEVMQKAIIKLGVLGALQTQCFMGELGKQWSQARDFFISALKIGYNVGELQTWHSTDSQTIQERIIQRTKQSLLMHSSLPTGCPTKIFFTGTFEEELETCLLQLTTNLLNKDQFTTSYSSNIAQAISVKNAQINNLLKVAHLVDLCNLSKNANCICYVIGFFNKVEGVQSELYKQRLSEIGDKFCETAIKQLEIEGKARDDIKEVLFIYMKKNKPISKIYQLIQVFLMISSPKEAVFQIMSLVQTSHATVQKQSDDLIRFAAANLVAVYCPEQLGTLVKVKTFQKEYSIESDIINLPNKLNSCLTVLVEGLILNNSGTARQILLQMVRLCNWLVIPLLGFPVSSRYDRNSQNKKLESLSIFMISIFDLHQILMELLAIGLAIPQGSVRTYFIEICLTTVSDQIVMELNTVLIQLDNLEDNNQYRYILELISLFMRVLQLNAERITTATNAPLLKKILKLYLRAVEKLNDILINSQDQLISQQVRSSLTQIYCPLINTLFEEQKNCRKWRACMKKICLTSLDIPIEHIINLRDFQLSSTRKDKGFLIHNSIDYSKQSTANGPINLDKMRKRAQQLLKNSRNAVFQNKNINPIFQKPDYLITTKQVKELDIEKADSKFTSKQFLLPGFSLKLIKYLWSDNSDVNNLLVDLLSMTPSSHHKLTQFALLTKNKQILFSIGLSKQTVQSLLPQILIMISREELPHLVDKLDQNLRKSISDNFNLMLTKQHYPNQQQQHKLFIDLSGALGFLVVLNQSNWRFLNEVANDLAIAKVNGLNSVPSLLLQYEQYIRITSLPNRDYQDRFKAYSEIVSAYSSLLKQKLQYLNNLQSSTFSQSTKKQHQNCITAQELRLFKLNQLAYVGSFCENFNVKDVLKRAADLRNQAKQISAQNNDKADKNKSKFEQLIATIDRIVQSLSQINKIMNQVAEGSIVCPDFIYSYRLCSNGCYNQAKIRLGENLQSYQIQIEENQKDTYVYQPQSKACSLSEYLKNFILTLQTDQIFQSQPKLAQTKESGDIVKQLIETFIQLEQVLKNKKLISIDSQSQQIKFCNSEVVEEKSEQQNPEIERLLFSFGVLYRCMQLTGQGAQLDKIKLGAIVGLLRKRQKLDWQSLKNLNAEAYHHIKAVLVDEEIQSRKIKFEYKGQPLFSQHGASIEVNKLNRQIYCNLVAKLSIGLRVWTRACFFAQGLTFVY